MKKILFILSLFMLSHISNASEEKKFLNGIINNDYKIMSILESTTKRSELNALVQTILRDDYKTSFPSSGDGYEMNCSTTSSLLDGVVRGYYLAKIGKRSNYESDLRNIKKLCSRLPFYKSLLSLLDKIDIAVTDGKINKETEEIIENQNKITAEKEKLLREERLNLEATAKRNMHFEKGKEQRRLYQEKIDETRLEKEMNNALIEEKKLQESKERMEVEMKLIQQERLIQKIKAEAIAEQNKIQSKIDIENNLLKKERLIQRRKTAAIVEKNKLEYEIARNNELDFSDGSCDKDGHITAFYRNIDDPFYINIRFGEHISMYSMLSDYVILKNHPFTAKFSGSSREYHGKSNISTLSLFTGTDENLTGTTYIPNLKHYIKNNEKLTLKYFIVDALIYDRNDQVVPKERIITVSLRNILALCK